PSNFVGYPEDLARKVGLRLTNASCPGETSSGFISLTGPDLGCRLYRSLYPLHVRYSTSQLDFAVSFLRTHPRTRLITLELGANDLFLLETQCAGSVPCVENGLPALLARLSSNLATIYGGIHRAAPHHHQLVAVTYYSGNYADPLGTGVISLI